MSHYSRFQTQFADPQLLCKALADVGYETVEQHEQPVQLRGFQGDLRADTANLVVRRGFIGGLSNDIGFIRKEDGLYEAIISDYDKRKHNDTWLQTLTQQYGVHATIQSLTEQGYELDQMLTEPDGSIRLVLNDYSIQ
jgi:hypothetical protein